MPTRPGLMRTVTETGLGSAPVSPGGTKMTCLIAEDNMINQNLLKKQLIRRGHSVLVADDGAEAVKVWETHKEKIDCILMDLAMPNMDGFDATEKILARIRELEGKRIPVIAVTAQAFAGNRELCFEKGMDGYIAKPVDINLLTSVMEEQYERYEKVWRERRGG
ncbi:hypothetical protein HK097_007441 [Rhizophlyctis rosea]|uniref:Response regulatory domain-containing protein n=1 Tax=Rhizophlyctis rosea TaxID=64517 RepID=A0AAD5SBR1_9FUNG|nr:hypothetical protein HK097_007441 [Rhizophlyctis rosea]